MLESRTIKSFKNAQVALIFYCVNLILQFFSRKIFIEYLGSEVLGLNTTAQNLLGFLNLAELGVGTAIAYCLYRPLYNNNQKESNDIVSIQGWLYRWIAAFVIIGAVALMCFFPKLFGKADLPLWYAYGTFSVLLFSSLLGYFINYRQIVLSADQKEYKITYIVQGAKSLKILIQILAICISDNGYMWWMILEAVFAILTSFGIDKIIKKEYPWLNPKLTNGKIQRKQYPQIVTKTKQLFFHRIGQYVLTQTSPLIIYAYASLTIVAIYGNYILIITGVQALVNALLNGIGAGVGNLVAEGNKERIKSFFWELTSLRLWMASVISFVIYMFADSFIILWVGNEFIMPKSAFIVLVVITFIQLMRTNDIFLSAYGLFQDIWAPIVEAILNIGFSILLGYYFGLAGILSGVLISLLIIVCTWKPIFLYTRAFKENPLKYFLNFAKYILLLGCTFIICEKLMQSAISLSSNNWLSWLVCAFISICIYSIVSLSVLYITDKASRCFMHRIMTLIINIKNDILKR